MIALGVYDLECMKDNTTPIGCILQDNYDKAFSIINKLPDEVDESIEVYYKDLKFLKKYIWQFSGMMKMHLMKNLPKELKSIEETWWVIQQ